MKIGILGTGAFGCCLANTLVNKNEVVMWTKFEIEKEELENTRKVSKLNNADFNSRIKLTTNVNDISNSDIIIIAIPVPFIRSSLELFKGIISNQIIVIASKGIEEKTNYFVSDIVKDVLNTDRIVVMGGGTFAIDVINNEKVGYTLAGNSKYTNIVKDIFDNNTKIDTIDEVYTIQFLSAIKNIYAIIFGMLDEMNVSISYKSRVFTDMIKEINTMIKLLGLNSNSIFTYCGIGDIYLTCNSDKSRNFNFGRIIVNKETDINEYLNNNTVEGVHSLYAIIDILNKKNVKLPLIDMLYEKIKNR